MSVIILYVWLYLVFPPVYIQINAFLEVCRRVDNVGFATFTSCPNRCLHISLSSLEPQGDNFTKIPAI